jgi:hypothetical protein
MPKYVILVAHGLAGRDMGAIVDGDLLAQRYNTARLLSMGAIREATEFECLFFKINFLGSQPDQPTEDVAEAEHARQQARLKEATDRIWRKRASELVPQPGTEVSPPVAAPVSIEARNRVWAAKQQRAAAEIAYEQTGGLPLPDAGAEIARAMTMKNDLVVPGDSIQPPPA